MAASQTAPAPPAQITPQQNPASTQSPPRPPLEIMTMPMWLWIQTPAAMTTTVTDPTVSPTPTTVTDMVVIDEVDWFLDLATPPAGSTPSYVCGNKTGAVNPTNSGPGIPYGAGYDPSNTNTASSIPEACVISFSAPYYSTDAAGAVHDGVHSLQANVFWHVNYTYTDPAGKVIGQGIAQPINAVPKAAALPAGGLTFRVGEIQALATSP